MKKGEKKEITFCIEDLINDYLNSDMGTEKLASKYHIGKLKVRQILDENNIPRKSKGKQPLTENFIVSDWKIPKYTTVEGKHYIAVDRNSGFTTKDIDNKAGILTTYIKNEYGVATPTLYDRRLYYMRTGNYWWEQWFDIKLISDDETKKCPYCEWETYDINNNSGAFEIHLKSVHGFSKNDYIAEHPEDREYFRTKNGRNDLQMETDSNKFVVCKVCGSKLKAITNHHLKIHGITKIEYINKFGNGNLICPEYLENCREQAIHANENVKFNRRSTDEVEIENFVKSLGFSTKFDRKILRGQEIDIFIPECNVGIEYNGNMWHTEDYGKNQRYHLNKTNSCEEQGIRLIHIFEDEYISNKQLVLNKIKNILKRDSDLPKIYGRKCKIVIINKSVAEEFLTLNHIQGFTSSTVYLGAYKNDKLVAVMTFLEEKDGQWNLTRYASDNAYHCVGVAGKLFKHFTKNYWFTQIKSFADRRWSWMKNNLYVQLGFTLDSILPPEYRYYNHKVDRYKRFHKFGFRKQILHKKYGLPLDMTEAEMTKALGYDRIWDCGLLKYVYINPELNQG